MENKNIDTNTIAININTLLSLCHMLDNFNEFNENCINFFCDNNLFDKLHKLIDISNNKFVLESDIKKFYNENKEYIDILKQNSNIYDFFYNLLYLE